MEDNRVPFQMQMADDDMVKFDSQQEEFRTDESMKASFDLAMRDTATLLFARNNAISDLEKQGGRILSVEEANAQYPMMKRFDKPISAYVAQHLFDQEQETYDLQKKITNGPKDYYTAAVNFGAGILAHAMDPLEFAVSRGVGGVVGGVMAQTAWGGKLAMRATQSTSARLGMQTLEAGAGNLVENVVQEVGIAATQGRENTEYDPQAGMVNVLASTFFGTALHVGVSEGSFRLNKILRNTTPNADLAMVRGVVSQVQDGIKPRVAPLAKALAQETDVRVNYEFQRATRETIPQRQFFVVADGPDLPNVNKRLVGEEYSLGTQVTDNPGVANAAAARSMESSHGVIHPIEPLDLNPLDLDQPLPDDVRTLLGELGDDFKNILNDPKLTGKEMLEEVWNAIDDGRADSKIIADIQEKFKTAGFDSTLHDGSRVAGFDHSPHNVLTVFDNEKLKSKGYHSPDPKKVRQPTPEELQTEFHARQNYENDLFLDMEELEKFRLEQTQDPSNVPDPVAEVDEVINEFAEEVQLLDKQGLASAELIKEVERLKDMEAQGVAELTAIKALAFCRRA